MSAMSASRIKLEEAAADVIQYIKSLPEFRNSRAAVFGGLALWKYMPRGRTTDDVDLIITVDGAPGAVKNRLLSAYGNVFTQRTQFFYYLSPSGIAIQIDICAAAHSPYYPPALTVVGTIPPGSVPYIAPIDLIVFKVFCCGLRDNILKKTRDATDAENLLQQETARSGPFTLSSVQRTAFEGGFPDVLIYSDQDESWWRARLR
ncbi:hypothetical protein VF21_07438 [Pseudogymnoascus sp. 05NY08]|nr:hypothetical protein VF21_07438 [Pseudogymnoascus sp. 05NY08]